MANAFFSDLLARFPSAAAACCAVPDHPTERRTPPTWSNYARRCCRAGAKPPAPRWRARFSTAITTSTRPAGCRFFETLARNFGPDREKLAEAIKTWHAQPSDEDASDLHFASEPRRQELIRRLNRAPGGTSDLVAMRADLLDSHEWPQGPRRARPRRRASAGSWFNRGFLVLRRIDWSTPANILEQIIRYEAVHEIRDWDDLRRRIDPADRRCYAFFHPALADEPLIFVEVALTETIPGAIAPLLAVRPAAGADRARPHRGVLFDLQHPTRARRHFVRQFPDQAGGRGIAPRIAEAGELRDAVAGAGLHAMAEAGGRRAAVGGGAGAARSARRSRLVRECGTGAHNCALCWSRSPRIIS